LNYPNQSLRVIQKNNFKMSISESTARRVIIRLSSALEQEVDAITRAWFQTCGFCEEDEVYEWYHRGHFMRVGWGDADRIHIIIDVNKDLLQDPDPKQIPHEIWKVVKVTTETSYVQLRYFLYSQRLIYQVHSNSNSLILRHINDTMILPNISPTYTSGAISD
jgi:hypothetical protein